MGATGVWDANNGERLTFIQTNNSNYVTKVEFSPDSLHLLLVTNNQKDSLIQVWNTISWKVIFSIQEDKSSFTSARFSPDGQRIVTVSTKYNKTHIENTLSLWNATNGNLINKWRLRVANNKTDVVGDYRGDNDNLTFSDFSPDDKRIITVNGGYLYFGLGN